MFSLKKKLKKNKNLYLMAKWFYFKLIEIRALPKYIFADKIVLNGRNKNKQKYLIFRFEGMSGLMTQMICVLGWLRYAQSNQFTLVVDMTSEENIYSDGTINSWERFYLQPMCNSSMGVRQIEEIKQTASFAICPKLVRHNLRYDWKYRNISKIIKPTITFPLPRDYKNRPELHREFSELYAKYIRYQPNIYEYINREYTELLGGKGCILGVLMRGTDYVQSKPFMHPIQPNIEQVFELIDKMKETYNWDYIYLATEELNFSLLLNKRYPGKVIENKRSYYDGDYSHQWLYSILKESDDKAYISGLEYLSSIYILSKCDLLSGGLCGGTQAALIMNGGKYKAIELFDSGDYGSS